MTEDHLFIGSLGRRLRGRGPVRQAWSGYFLMVPDYRITIESTFVDGEAVVVGKAYSNYVPPTDAHPIGRWRTPAA